MNESGARILIRPAQRHMYSQQKIRFRMNTRSSQNYSRASRTSQQPRQNVMDELRAFMSGRNGMDELSLLLCEVACVLYLLSWLVPLLHIPIILILVYVVFRLMSYNISARRREAWAVISHFGPYRLWILNPLRAFREFKTYTYITCTSCKKYMRVPKGKGHIRVTCPHCSTKFEHTC